MGKYSHPVHGWDAVRLYRNLTMPQLTELLQALYADPANANPAHAAGHDIHLYTKSSRRKMDAIAWAITYHLKDKKDAA
jgi:hypothetical protein